MTKKKGMARKRFGQHFLHDEETIHQIIQSGDIEPEDCIFEIGPGQGAITEFLLRSGASVTSVEIDWDLVRALKQQFADYSNFQLVQGDILTLDWLSLLSGENRQRKMIANLPYNISTPLFFLFIKYRRFFHSFTIMIQKEVALRICSDGLKKKKDYGVLSVITSNVFKAEWVCDVGPSCFSPPPKVHSAVIRLIPQNHSLEKEEDFFRFVQEVFQQRRKLFIPQLKKKQPDIFNRLSPEEIEHFSPLRPEDVTPTEYWKLFQGREYKGTGKK